VSSPSARSSSWKKLLRYVIPAASALVLFSLYTLVDAAFVSHGVGELALTSVNIAAPFINLVSGIAILLTMGTATLCSFALGEGNRERAEALFSQSTALMAILSGVITALVLLFARPIALRLGAGPETIENSVCYLRIIAGFSICFILTYCLEVMVKVDDSPILSVVGNGVSALLNIGLDALFIFVFHWGVMGAALATGLAQTGSLITYLIYFLGPRSDLKFRRFRWQPREYLRILPLGVADCSVEFVLGFMTILYNNVLILLYGANYQTIYAVLAYVSIFVFMLMQGITQGMMPLVSFSVGQKDPPSIRFYFRKTSLLMLFAAILITALCQCVPGGIVRLFLSADSPLFSETISALRQYSLSFLLCGFNILLAGYFTSLGRGGSSALLSLVRGFVLLPVSLLLLSRCGFLWMAALAGETVSLGLGLFLLYRIQKK